MEHRTEEELLLFVTEQATEEEAADVAAHLAECEACFWRVRGLRYLRDNLDSFLDSWGPEEYARLCRETAMVATCDGVTSAGTKIQKFVEVAITFAIDCVKKTARAITSNPSTGYQFPMLDTAAGVGSPDAHMSSLDTGPDSVIVREIFHEGRRIGQLTVDVVKQSLHMKYWPGEGGSTAYLVLRPKREELGGPITVEFGAVIGADYLLAEFADLQDGEYDLELCVEPISG